jgi:hypothetical protein
VLINQSQGHPGEGALWGILEGNEMLFACEDCGFDVAEGEYICLNDAVWEAAIANSHAEFLCLRCIEKRLNRQLTRNDFPVRTDLSLMATTSEYLRQIFDCA